MESHYRRLENEKTQITNNWTGTHINYLLSKENSDTEGQYGQKLRVIENEKRNKMQEINKLKSEITSKKQKKNALERQINDMKQRLSRNIAKRNQLH